MPRDRAMPEPVLRDANRLMAADVGDQSVMKSFSITDSGVPAKARLFSTEKLTRDDFDQIVSDLQGRGGEVKRARKITFVAGRVATAEERVETRYNGLETTAVARPGDWVVTNLDIHRQILRDGHGNVNQWVIQPDRFKELYRAETGTTEFGVIHKATGVVDVIAFPGGFDIVAPWGEKQVGDRGYILRNGDDIYGIHADAYAATYEELP